MTDEGFPPGWRYTPVARWLHWLLAVLLIFMLGLGWVMTAGEHEHGAPNPLVGLHKSVGLAVLGLALLRLLWRIAHRPAPLPDSVPRWQRSLAVATEWGLYACMVAMPLLGYLGAAHQQRPPRFFGLPTPAWARPDHELAERLFEMHELVGWLLTALIVLHVAGALKHLLIDKDGVFRRMSLGAGRDFP